MVDSLLLPYFDADAPPAAVARAYAAAGVAILRGFFREESIESVRAELEAFARSPRASASNLRCRFQTSGSGPILDAVDPVLDVVPSVRALAESPALANVLAALLGDRPVLFKDKAHFRRPGVKGYSLHQDYIAWPGFPATFTTVLVALDPATAESGCLEVYVGQHRRGYLSPRDGDFHDLSPSAFPETSRQPVELEPGDIAVFGAFLPHGSGPNRSDKPRRQVYLSYNARFDGGDLRDAHYAQYFRWLEERYRRFGHSSARFE